MSTDAAAPASPGYSPTLSAFLERVPEPAGGVTTQWVDYDVDGVACRGFLAAGPGTTTRPGVLVLADWMGVHPYIQMRCEMLARLGYVAFAGDVYGADVTPTQETAPQLAGGFYGDQPLWRQRLVAGYEQLLARPGVDASRTAAIGYCFGGSGALQLARTGADLAAVVTFHGGLQTGPEGEAEKIKAKLLILTGAIDPVVPPEAVAALEAELRGVPSLDWQLTTYAASMHAFTLPDANAPDHGALYNPAAERRSWAAMRSFLDEVLAAA